MEKFKEGQQVTWDAKSWQTYVATGVVRGYASKALPVMGAMVIVEVAAAGSMYSTDYPYSCLCLPEVALVAVE